MADGNDTQEEASATVKVKVPPDRPVMVALVPVPVEITSSGLLVNVHVPDDGKPFNTTLPVATLQEGWVMVPTVGADGVAI